MNDVRESHCTRLSWLLWIWLYWYVTRTDMLFSWWSWRLTRRPAGSDVCNSRALLDTAALMKSTLWSIDLACSLIDAVFKNSLSWGMGELQGSGCSCRARLSMFTEPPAFNQHQEKSPGRATLCQMMWFWNPCSFEVHMLEYALISVKCLVWLRLLLISACT